MIPSIFNAHMKIGYPCLNRSLGCKVRTFRLKSYSEERLVETAGLNLECLMDMLRFNAAQGLLFFRISSDLVPFASHPICGFDWQGYFKKKFYEIGCFIKQWGMRISMHPDQFTLLNSTDNGIFERSSRELAYHADVLDLMELDETAKIQIHIGGVYGNRQEAVRRFATRYTVLESRIKRRLVIENDDRSYTLRDCLEAGSRTGIPVLLDSFHHDVNSSGESLQEALQGASATWKAKDGLPMVDYSSQFKNRRQGVHSMSLDPCNFRDFLRDRGPSIST